MKKFWYWMNERQRIYLAKERGEPKPWTKDKIFQQYKFTNVFREQDTVTIELRRMVRKSDTQWRQLWKTYVFRMFNWPGTYHALHYEGLVDQWNAKAASRLLKQRVIDGFKVFTGAYIITNAGSTRPKIDIICEALTPMWQSRIRIAKWIRKSNSIEAAVAILREFPNVGAFVGYEIATDLRHTSLLRDADDIMTWANTGPGAARGLNRIFRRGPRNGPPNKRVVHLQEMRDLLGIVTHKVDPSIFVGWNRKFEMRDIEHSLCEYDKYMRVLKGEGRPRSRYDGTG